MCAPGEIRSSSSSLMHGFSVAVLRGLIRKTMRNDDGGAGVDYQLPGVAPAEQGARDGSHHYDQQREHEAHGLTGHVRQSPSKSV